jgi:cyclopropane fatty-acyl-phospholipid synthase-like methyltransferase
VAELTPHFGDVQSHDDLPDDGVMLLHTIHRADARRGADTGRQHGLEARPHPFSANALRAHARHLGQGIQAHGDDAIAARSEEIYDRYLWYLTGCADIFKNRYIDINRFTNQFTLAR